MNHRDGTTLVDTPVGGILLAARAEGLTHLLFTDRRGRPVRAAHPPAGDGSARSARILADAAGQLREYFAGERREFDLPLAPEGTGFQLAVWRGLQDIPYGKTVSYGELARSIGRPRASRAVGAANGANPLSIVVPCHRVIGSDGSLTGFGGGLPAKRLLLDLETGTQHQPD